MSTPDIRCISFDCYGTLIDWETGLLSALHATLPEMLLERTGLRPREVLHVAESLFHDIAPAQPLGITTVWVNRANGRDARASKLADTTPDVTVCDLNALADRIC